MKLALLATAMAAGVLVLAAAIPEILANLRNPRRALGQSLWRSGMQCLGNILWSIHGAISHNDWLTTVAVLGALLALVLTVQGVRARIAAKNNMKRTMLTVISLKARKPAAT